MRRKRRIFFVILILLTSLTSYYFVEFNYEKNMNELTKRMENKNDKLFEDKTPEEVIDLIKEKINELENKIHTHQKILPHYDSPIQVYEKVISTMNLLGNKTELNIEKVGSSTGAVNVEKFKIRGEGKFRDIFALINLFESAPEIYKIHLKELKQIFSTDSQGKLEEKVFIDFILDAYYTSDKHIYVDSLVRVNNRRTTYYITDYFEPLIKMEIPPNDEGLFEVDGAKLIAILPDGVYLLDKKGNSFNLLEGDPVYLGYLSKIDFENQRCEFILNKGGIFEKVTLNLDK